MTFIFVTELIKPCFSEIFVNLQIFFHQLIDFVTQCSQIDETGGSIIDLVYIDTPEILQSISPLPGLGKSDHDIVTFSLCITKQKASQSHPVLMYHKLNIDHTKFKRYAMRSMLF